MFDEPPQGSELRAASPEARFASLAYVTSYIIPSYVILLCNNKFHSLYSVGLFSFFWTDPSHGRVEPPPPPPKPDTPKTRRAAPALNNQVGISNVEGQWALLFALLFRALWEIWTRVPRLVGKKNLFASSCASLLTWAQQNSTSGSLVRVEARLPGMQTTRITGTTSSFAKRVCFCAVLVFFFFSFSLETMTDYFSFLGRRGCRLVGGSP